MLSIPVYNPDGRKIDTLQVDEKVFGGRVNVSLLKQALVTIVGTDGGRNVIINPLSGVIGGKTQESLGGGLDESPEAEQEYGEPDWS